MFEFKVGDNVVVKPGTKDPDFGTDLSGWHGRITAIDPAKDNLIDISWDSLTLKNIPLELIVACEAEHLDISSMALPAKELEPIQPRDTSEEAQALHMHFGEQLPQSNLSQQDDELAQNFFAQVYSPNSDNDRDVGEDDSRIMGGYGFEIQEFFNLLEIRPKEQPIIEKCLEKGLYKYYYYIYGFAKYGQDVHWLIAERMYEPFIFGFGAVEIIENKHLSDETKQKVIAYVLTITNPTEEYGIPYGLMFMLRYMAQQLILNNKTFNLIMLTVHASPHGLFDDLSVDGWVDISNWLINSEQFSDGEKLWWIWYLSLKLEDNLSANQGKKVAKFWLENVNLLADAKLDLCWAWLLESKDLGERPIPWRMLEAQMTGDVKGLRESLKIMGARPAEINSAIRNMEQIHAEFHNSQPGDSFMMPSFGELNYIMLPAWLKRLAVPTLIKYGENLFDVCVMFLDKDRNYGSDGINKGVADALELFGERLSFDELRCLIEKGLQIPQASTRKTFYQVSQKYYGNEYMVQTKSDPAASIRKWGATQLN